MATQLEELVEFLHHGNITVRGTAVEHLVGYSQAQPAVFKSNGYTPIKDLKLLIRDDPSIAKNALTILVNLSADPAILENLASDDEFVKTVLTRTTDPKLTTATELTMLLANLSKHPNLAKVLTLDLPARSALGASPLAINQLLSAFLLGQDKQYNAHCDYDYLAYVLAELARMPAVRTFLVTPRPLDDDNQMPVSKLLVFTQHKSVVRRRGVAAAIKNVCFEVSAHAALVSAAEDSDGGNGANVLPYILLPLMGNESYADEESDAMPIELQLLEPDKEREPENDIIVTLLEALLLLTTSRVGREEMRRVQVYPIVRECHLNVEDEDVRSACDRLVQVLMREEAPEGENENGKITELDDDEDMQIIDV